MKRLLLVLLGLGILLNVSLVWTIIEKGNRIKRRLYKADHTRILADGRALIAVIDALPSSEKYRETRSWAWIGNRTDPLFRKYVPQSIDLLNPSYAAVSDKEVMLCFSLLPRVYLLVFQTNTQEYGSVCITNGLWLSNNPDRDRRGMAMQLP
jgi:hypothetical protein